MNCSKCNGEVSADGKCMGCGLSQEECTCLIAEKTPEAEPSEKSESGEESTEEKTVE